MNLITNIFIILSFILTLGLPLLAEPVQNNDFIVARKSFQDGFYDIAAKSFQKFISQSPQDADVAEARLLLGESLVHLKRFNDAIKELDRVIGLEGVKGFKAEALYWKAEIYFKTKDFQRAKELYNKLIKDSPSSKYVSYAMYSLAWSLYEEKDYKKALEKFSLFLTKNPSGALKRDSRLKICEILYRL